MLLLVAMAHCRHCHVQTWRSHIRKLDSAHYIFMEFWVSDEQKSLPPHPSRHGTSKTSLYSALGHIKPATLPFSSSWFMKHVDQRYYILVIRLSIRNSLRWKAGVAASLNYIQLSDEPSPVLHPYPNWESHNLSGNDFSGESSEEESKWFGSNLFCI